MSNNKMLGEKSLPIVISTSKKIQTEKYETFLPYIKELGGFYRWFYTMYDKTGFYSLTVESDKEPLPDQLYTLIRQSGFSAGAYSLEFYHTEKVEENLFKALFAAAGIGLVVPQKKEE
jgi:hypothetical protein